MQPWPGKQVGLVCNSLITHTVDVPVSIAHNSVGGAGLHRRVGLVCCSLVAHTVDVTVSNRQTAAAWATGFGSLAADTGSAAVGGTQTSAVMHMSSSCKHCCCVHAYGGAGLQQPGPSHTSNVDVGCKETSVGHKHGCCP
jgi:hypothetical protein